jgi:hypothetical protein
MEDCDDCEYKKERENKERLKGSAEKLQSKKT